MSSISAPISTSSPSFSLFQKPMITTYGSPVLRLPSMSKMGKVRCSTEGKPAITSDDAKSKVIEGKTSWPELVGVKGEVAVAIIEKENPRVFTEVIPADTPFVTPDFGFNRVRVFLNSEGLVDRTPVIG